MVTFLFVATLAILEFLWSAARGESSRQERAGLQILLPGEPCLIELLSSLRRKFKAKRKIKMPTHRIPASLC
jgi:hypothetical protein